MNLFILAPSPAYADQSLMTRGLEAIKRDNWQEARQFLGDGQDPLAARLYYWFWYAKNKDENAPDFATLNQFIRSSPDWPGIDDLCAKAERVMPYDTQAGDAISWFAEHPPQNARGLDLYMSALLSSGQTPKARDFITAWWAKTLVSRDEQKDLYAKYAPYIGMEAHRSRFDMLLFAGQYTNARAMAGVLGPGYPELAEARIALAAQAPDVNARIAHVPQGLQNDPGLLFERVRYRRKNNSDDDAMQLLLRPIPAGQIQNPEDWWKERHIIIRRMMEKRRFQDAYRLASSHSHAQGAPFAEAEWLSGWLALRYIGKPQKAFDHFQSMYTAVKTPVSKARGAYWAARAAEELPNPAAAKSWYQEAARYQTVYYGQLAGAKLGLENALPNAAPPQLSAEDKKAFDRLDLIRAARILNAAGYDKEASRFLKKFVLNNENDPKAYRYAAEMAASLKRFADAVRIAKDATAKGMFLTAQSYPVVTERLRNVDTEWALVHAIIRQESMFDQDALSPAGARGLMQVMPATGREVARKYNVSDKAGGLSDPSYNITIGSSYLNSLLARYDGSYPLAIAAYNGGIANVDRWLVTFGDPRAGQVDFIDWIEMIPFSETRNYVQRVLENIYVYRLRLKNVQKQPFHPIHIAFSR